MNPSFFRLEHPELFAARGDEVELAPTRIALSRDFEFWGPWMSGCKAELRFEIKVVEGYQKPDSLNRSLFHPRVFESAIARDLSESCGGLCWARRAGPFDWKTHNHLPVLSASCTLYHTLCDGERLGEGFDFLLFFPLTDRYFVRISFTPDMIASGPTHKPTFDPSPVQALQDAILNSMTLELSPQAEASYDKIKTECPDMRLTETFAPLNWPPAADTPGENDTSDSPPADHNWRAGADSTAKC